LAALQSKVLNWTIPYHQEVAHTLHVRNWMAMGVSTENIYEGIPSGMSHTGLAFFPSPLSISMLRPSFSPMYDTQVLAYT